MTDALMKSRARLAPNIVPDGIPAPQVLVRDGNVYRLGRPERPLAKPRDYSIESLQAAGVPITEVHAPFGVNLTDIDFDAVSQKLDNETLISPSNS